MLDCRLVIPFAHTIPDTERDREAVDRAWFDIRNWLMRRGFMEPLAERVSVIRVLGEDEDVVHLCATLHNHSGKSIYLVRGAGGYAGALWWGGAILGDACLDELCELPRPTACDEIVKGDKWQCSRCGQIGSIIHEVLHLYGIADSEMDNFKEWPYVRMPANAWHLPFDGTWKHRLLHLWENLNASIRVYLRRVW